MLLYNKEVKMNVSNIYNSVITTKNTDKNQTQMIFDNEEQLVKDFDENLIELINIDGQQIKPIF